TALWAPVNAKDPAWFFPPSAFKDVILAPEATFIGPVAAALKGEVGQVVWFARLEGDGLTAAQATPVLGRVESLRARAAGIVQGLKLEQSPAEALNRYRSGAVALTLQLFVFSAPILGLVFYFVALVAALLIARQRAEIALLKTRGVRDVQILGIYVVEWLILGAVALAAGPALGLFFAEFMGRTRSFLQIAAGAAPLPLALTWDNLRFGVAAVALGLLAPLVPAAVATRRPLAHQPHPAAPALPHP